MSTINEPPGLSELPIEMVLHIASFCPHDDRKAMSLVSKQMRSHLHRHLFRAVSFHGHGEQVLEALEEFLSGKSDLVNRGGYKHILHATIVVTLNGTQADYTLASQANNEHETGSSSPRPSISGSALPSRIIESMTILRTVQSFTLNLSGLSTSQEKFFLRTMHKMEPWRFRNFMIASNLGKALESKIIRHCSVNTLEGLSICSDYSLHTYSAATNFHRTIRKLSVCVPKRISLARLDILNPDFIVQLAEDFLNLEWLALSSCPHRSSPSGEDEGTSPAAFEILLSRFLEALKRFPKLKRFAFPLRSWNVAGVVPDHLSTASHNTTGWNRWFIDLTHRIGEELPQLEDLVILRFYARTCRGTRDTEGSPMTVRLVDIHQRTQVGQFPFGFDKPDHKHWRHFRKTMTK